MAIKGVKLEDQAVFIMDETSKDWIKATTSHLQDLEKLLRKAEISSFPNKSIREDVIFENEFNIGLGSVKSFKDEDGDLVYTFQKEKQIRPIEIDEDFEFVQDTGVHHSTNTTIPSGNAWGSASKNTQLLESSLVELSLAKDSMKEVRKQRKVGREVYDISFEKPLGASEETNSEKRCKMEKESSPKIKDCIAQTTSVLNHDAPKYTFRKRICNDKDNNRRKALKQMLRDFQMHRDVKESTVKTISFAKKSRYTPLNRKQAELVNSILRHNKIYGNKEAVDWNFYLFSEKKCDLIVDDQEFNDLLKAVTGMQ